ncbi:hypothetical protein LCGC14_0761260 [marine sediment metagenome]|uniref:M23ase beta-sheet core domain-containing protein n=1 Tax=marine sediment metagenome TaxID=412755 RepID=A0A0F9Q155_9ZZZZ
MFSGVPLGALPTPFPGIQFSRPAAYAPLVASGVWGDLRSEGTRFHQGIDIAMPKGTPVLAMAPGKVYTARMYPDPTGIFVGIQHANGWSSRYMHLDSVAVQKGETVKRGQVIGYAGATGGVSGPHLHLSMLLDKSKLGEFARAYGQPTTGWGNTWNRGTAVPGEPVVPLDQYTPDALERMRSRNVLPYQRSLNAGKWFALGSALVAIGVGAFVFIEGRKRGRGFSGTGGPPIERQCVPAFSPKEVRKMEVAGTWHPEFQGETCKWKCVRPFKVAQFEATKNPGNFAILHPSTKAKGKWQLSLFDKDGPWGDRIRDTCSEAATELQEVYRQWRVVEWE